MSAANFSGSKNGQQSFRTIVIGGGQAGLAVGYHLAQQGENFIILDENEQTGASWRKRWDSLRLFTPCKVNNLPGMSFPAPRDYFPTRNEVADYLQAYASNFNLPIQHGMQVRRLARSGDKYLVSTDTAEFTGDNIIIATGPFQKVYIPEMSRQLDPAIRQLHSSTYQNPASMPAQSVLVVGAGNSGAEIALELVRAGKQVVLSGRDVGRIPAASPIGRAFDGRFIWWVMQNVLNVNTPVGRKVQAAELHHGAPLGRATRQELSGAGVELAPRLSGVQSGKPQLEDGRILPVDGVLWATGFRPDYDWIQLPILDEQGYPKHRQGVVEEAPGIYFVGLQFQTALTSSLLGGVGRDAEYIAEQVRKKEFSSRTRKPATIESAAP